MIANFFALVQLLLKLIGLWEQFLDWSDKKRIADAEINRQEREKAVDDQSKASSEKEFDDAQSRIIDHKPR